jgi:outer membrane protein TolC
MKVFRNLLVEEAFERSPEIKQLDESIAAVKRSITSIKRSFWLPALVVSGQMNQRLLESGAGTGGLNLPPEAAAFADMFPSQDDTTWSVGVALSWPLFEGGLRMANLDQSHAELARLETQLKNVKLLIEQRVRASLQNTRASGANIELSKAASEAAKKNLKLVTDAYSRGALSILELLDAQNAALISDLSVVNAQFAFMADLIRAQRATGGFFILLNEEERKAWAEKFEAHMKKHGEKLPQNR